MKKFSFLFLLISSFVFSQKKKNYGPDIVSNIDAKVLLMKPLGNNFAAKDMEIFYGFGFGGNLMTKANLGLGADFNMLFSNYKYGHENMAGNISGPVLTNLDVYLVHRNALSEEFFLEEFAGPSYFVLSSQHNETGERHKDKAVGFHAGVKPIYTLDREGYQQVFLSGKVSFYYSDVFNSNPQIQKYYSRSVFATLSLGYRYNF